MSCINYATLILIRVKNLVENIATLTYYLLLLCCFSLGLYADWNRCSFHRLNGISADSQVSFPNFHHEDVKSQDLQQKTDYNF